MGPSLTETAGCDRLSRLALGRYDLGGIHEVRFVRHGENTTFRVRSDAGEFALRVHRPAAQTRAAVRSELAWMASLRAAGLPSPLPRDGIDGLPVQAVRDDSGHERLTVLFSWVDGLPLTQVDRLEHWRELGSLMAAVHEHARSWRPPPWFERPAWDFEALVGEQPRWGDPLRLGRWDRNEETSLLRARDIVRRRLRAFGRSPARYGLIHADLSFENVLIDPTGGAVLIDFDDGGRGWFLYDVAVSLFPHMGDQRFADRRDALIDGYSTRLVLQGLDELPTFLMARRLATLGWTFSRADTAHARAQRNCRLGILLTELDAYIATMG